MAEKKPKLIGLTRVKEAREALKEKSAEIVELLIETAIDAKAHGEFETAAKSLQWLLEHMPADEDGGKVIDSSVDKQAKIDPRKQVGPQIQIGFAIGGIPAAAGATKQLPAVEVIDVEKDKS